LTDFGKIEIEKKKYSAGSVFDIGDYSSPDSDFCPCHSTQEPF